MRGAAISFSFILAGAASAFVAARPAAAAETEQSREIPTAKLTQQLGLTEIAVEYECPAVQGRRIWGGVVPYDRPWMVGDSSSARIKFSKDVRIGAQVVPAGSYWLLALPGKSGWSLMLNKSPDLGTSRAYKPELDVVRVRAVPKTVVRRERLLFTFSDMSEDQASLDLEWDNLRVSVPIEVYTRQKILTSISGLDGTWRAFSNAARYMLETAKDFDAGLKYIDQALALKDDWYSMWIKGALFAAKGDYRSAREWAVKANELAEKAGNGAALAPDLRNAIAEWTRKSGGRPADEAVAAKKVGDEPTVTVSNTVSNVARVQDEPPTAAPAFKPSQDEPHAKAPASRTAPEKEASRAPSGDPPLLHRARLRRR